MAAEEQPLVGVAYDHPALLTFTSGSTGEPRGVVRTHGFLDRQQQAITRDLQLNVGQSSLTTMPMFVLAHLAAGVHSILGDVQLRRPDHRDPERLTQQITALRPGRLLASPALLDQLAEHCRSRSIVLNSLQRIDTGGAPVFPRTIDKLRRAMPHARLMVVYGSTEVEPVALLDVTRPNAELRQRIAQGAGLPAGETAADLEVRLLTAPVGSFPDPIGADDFAVLCQSGSNPGEIIVRGKRVLSGYLDGVGDCQAKIAVDGEIWHRTGDLGLFDREGKLWLLGRVTAQLRDDQGCLQPLAVEAAAMELPSVVRCALVAIAGQRVLVVELAQTAAALWRAELSERLVWAKLDRIKVVQRIPVDRRHRAKIDYPALRCLVGADASPQTITRTVPAAPSISTASPS